MHYGVRSKKLHKFALMFNWLIWWSVKNSTYMISMTGKTTNGLFFKSNQCDCYCCVIVVSQVVCQPNRSVKWAEDRKHEVGLLVTTGSHDWEIILLDKEFLTVLPFHGFCGISLSLKTFIDVQLIRSFIILACSNGIELNFIEGTLLH